MSKENLKKICQLALNSHGLNPASEVDEPKIYWEASFYNAEETSLYKGLNESSQSNFLTNMSTHILQEACAIEKAGLTYSARMNLMTTNVEEKILYSLIGAEEALHLKSLEPYLHISKRDQSPFFGNLIAQWIEKLDRPALLVMIQILLEGWGIHYYGTLSQQAKNSDLQEVFQKILADEARHHATGIVLYRHEILSAKERTELENELIQLFQCVQIGPQQVVYELALNSNENSIDFHKLLVEMNAFEATTLKLEKLRRLLDKTYDLGLAEECLKKDLFKPFSVDKMAQLAESQFLGSLKNQVPARDSKAEPSL